MGVELPSSYYLRSKRPKLTLFTLEREKKTIVNQSCLRISKENKSLLAYLVPQFYFKGNNKFIMNFFRQSAVYKMAFSPIHLLSHPSIHWLWYFTKTKHSILNHFNLFNHCHQFNNPYHFQHFHIFNISFDISILTIATIKTHL